MIKVIEENCPQNHKCPMARMCPKQAISQEGHQAPEIDGSKCVECGICVKHCPHNCFVKEKN